MHNLIPKTKVGEAYLLSFDEIEQWQNLLAEIAGIHLDPTKDYLLPSRLGALCQKEGCSDLMALYEKVKADGMGKLAGQVVQMITTHETSFFRHPPSFGLFAKLLLELAPKKVRVLSAGCSTGEEAWSLAMTAERVLGRRAANLVSITGWDIAPGSIDGAREARYQFLDKKLEPELLERFFDHEEKTWRVKQRLRSWVNFERRNLLHMKPDEAPFTIIFCKNVAIYFEMRARTRFFEELVKLMEPSGYMVLGSSESLIGITDCYKRERRDGVYAYRPK